MRLLKFKIILCTIAFTLILSCGIEKTTSYKDKPVLFCYAKAGESIDSLYFSRTGGVNESISFSNLGISGAIISLYERAPFSTEFSLVGILSEYETRIGVYYLPQSDFTEGFRAGYFYRIEAIHDDLDRISAETLCPPPLGNIVARNLETGDILTSVTEDPSAVDTVYYRRGRSYDDIRFYSCSFDSLPVILDKRMASYRIIPDDLYRYDEAYWLEDTTSVVWDKYPVETRI